ncbi:MAG: hypothetical protein IJ646_06460 [Clostridia bacterium]|nr:hypothetical protein [Clostridia bacterium]
MSGLMDDRQKRLDIAEALFGILPQTMTLEEALERREHDMAGAEGSAPTDGCDTQVRRP